jgi:hypothetical protein
VWQWLVSEWLVKKGKRGQCIMKVMKISGNMKAENEASMRRLSIEENARRRHVNGGEIENESQ